jgi:D-alanyl-D-alanine carboxypeptidase
MNTNYFTSFLLLSCIFFTSCKKDYITTESTINCNLDFKSHSKNTNYQALIDRYTREGFVGMTVLIDEPTNGLWIGSSGYASIENKVKMNPCHIHHTASLYKTYIATIIMQLEEEGKINIDDKLTQYLSADITNKLPNGKNISIKNLLQQRSGLPDIFEVDFILDFFNTPNKTYTIEELLEYIYDKNALSDVDTEFHYSDANFSLLTLVINKIEGSHVEAIKNRIFTPLKLNETYYLENTNQAPAGLVDSYWDRYNNGKIENISDTQTTLTVGLRGSDGIVTSANDLKIFIQALAKGQLVKNITEMTDFIDTSTDEKKQEVYSGYGYGLMKVNISGTEWFGHFGNQIGSGAIVLYNADKDITIVALQNSGTFFSDDIKKKFFYLLIKDIEDLLQ